MSPERWRQIEHLFHLLSERPAEERAQILDGACGDDPELRREVERLLTEVQPGSHLLDRPAWEAGGNPLAGETVTQLAVGTQLGPYKIESPLGAGGMGQVYKGRDTRLGRPVAIKIAHQQFSERFEREARAISALNHPHICTVYDVGPNYLVMELVEGETLAVRIKKGALPIAEVLRYGAEIADALAEAHSKSITHRDLKPANVMIAKAGVKVLDFGLAKFSKIGDGLGATFTQAGAIMGTPAYMAPEQREGKEADARTDIYALGLTLYEMATGKRIEPGQQPATDGLATHFAHVIERCLDPDPERRWQTARDVKAELDWASRTQPERVGTLSSASHYWPYALAALGLFMSAAVWSLWQLGKKPSEQRVLHLQIEPPNGGSFVNVGNASVGGLALSPDGRTAAFVANVQGQTGLWVRPLDGASARLLPETDSAAYPFWSPDGKSIAFSAKGKLQRVDVAGGSPVTMWETAGTRQGAWLPGGRIVLSGQSGLMLASAPGDVLTPLTELDASRKERSHTSPQSLPGGRLLYLAVSSIPENSGIYAISLAKPLERVRILATNTSAVYASGYLLWWNGGTLMAQEFDPATLKVGGEARPLAESVTRHEPTQAMNLAASANGYLLYDASEPRIQVQWVDRSGRPLAPPGELSGIGNFRISPDGRRIAAIANRPGAPPDLWIVDENGLATRNTPERPRSEAPVWSPDGQNMVLTLRLPESNLCRIVPNLSSDPVRLTNSPNVQYPTDWSRDGQSLLFYEITPGTQRDLWILPLIGANDAGVKGGQPRRYAATAANESWGRFSPEPHPHWIAYQSDESGRFQIYVQAFPEPGRKFRVSPHGGSHPKWGPDGRELYYESLDKKLVSVNLTLEAGSVEASAPRELFDLASDDSGSPAYDIAPDGKRFAVRVDTRSSRSLTLVTNWPALIKTGPVVQ